MTTLLRLAFAVALQLVPANSALAQSAAPRPPEVRRSAQEQAPEALIGGWKLDLIASKYETTPPKAQYRIFDYTHDGMLLVHYLTLSANGAQASGNWAVQLDGSAHVEYTRGFGSTPFAVVTLMKQDDLTLYLTAARYGKVFETGTFTLTTDGQILTFNYTVDGKTNNAVYRRWNLQD
jgi:hypothetical protein